MKNQAFLLALNEASVSFNWCSTSFLLEIRLNKKSLMHNLHNIWGFLALFNFSIEQSFLQGKELWFA